MHWINCLLAQQWKSLAYSSSPGSATSKFALDAYSGPFEHLLAEAVMVAGGLGQHHYLFGLRISFFGSVLHGTILRKRAGKSAGVCAQLA